MNLTRPNLPECGYQVFPGTVPLDLCTAVVDAIEQHTEGGKYGGSTPDGLVELYHHQSMWDVRQFPALHYCFSQVLGTENLWVSLDRVCRKTPLSERDKNWPGFMHWDVNPNIRPRLLEVQGLVALTDTEENSGGFWCVPTLYQNLDVWRKAQLTKKILRTNLEVDIDGKKCLCFYPTLVERWWADHVPKLEGWGPTDTHFLQDIVKVPMKAGDLLVWDSYLPHGNGPNKSDKTRYCQYVTMSPVGPTGGNERLRRERVLCWESNAPPSGLAFFGDPRGIEQARPPAELTEYGKKLLGVSEWADPYSYFHQEDWGD